MILIWLYYVPCLLTTITIFEHEVLPATASLFISGNRKDSSITSDTYYFIAMTNILPFVLCTWSLVPSLPNIPIVFQHRTFYGPCIIRQTFKYCPRYGFFLQSSYHRRWPWIVATNSIGFYSQAPNMFSLASKGVGAGAVVSIHA